MAVVKLTGWQAGLRKISLTKIIRKHTGYGLAKGKKCVDDVLEDIPVLIPDLSNNVAEELLREVRSVGAVAEIDLEDSNREAQ